MLTVWGRVNSSNVKKVLWCLEELNIAYNQKDVGGPFGGLDTPEYIKMNPNSTIPTLQDDDFALWESNAILRYLTENLIILTYYSHKTYKNELPLINGWIGVVLIYSTTLNR